MSNVLPLVASGRKLSSWVAGFMEYTEGMWSTPAFRLWSSISAIAGALERKVWIRSQGADIYPNLYIFLVGPPGAGKTRPVEVCSELWKELKEHHIAPVSLTKASLMDKVGASTRSIPYIGGDLSFNSLLVASKELGALIPNYDPDFLNALTYLYDNARYDEERRGNKVPLIIESPIVNLIGCTTPSYLLGTMPPGAWDQGFLSRVIIIYDDIVLHRPLDLSEDGVEQNEGLRSALMHDIKLIGKQISKMNFSPEAGTVIQNWYSRRDDMPAHPRLQNYNTRRPIHLLKLAMIACADRGISSIISLDDAQVAIDWLTEAEKKMGDVFTAMASGGDAQVINECWHYVMTYFARTNKPVPAHEIYNFLKEKVPAYAVVKIVDIMIRSKIIVGVTVEGITVFTPKPREADGSLKSLKL